MREGQRKWLLDKIKKEAKAEISSLEKQKKSSPSRANYLFRAALNGDLELQPESTIRQAIVDKALRAKEGENWLSDDRMGFGKLTTIRLKIEDVLVIPEDWRKEYADVYAHNAKINAQIEQIELHLNKMEVQIMLSSNKKLEALIQEVDNWADVKLIDTKLKALPQ